MMNEIESKSRFDVLTVLLFLALATVGLLSIYSSSIATDDGIINLSNNYERQIMFLAVSIIIGSMLFLIETRFFEVFSYWFFAFWIAMLILVIFIGTEKHGARSWFSFGGFLLQPSEFTKLGVALALSKYISDIDTDMKSIRYQLFTAGIVLLPILLIVLQGDAGSGLVFFSFALVLYREGLSGVILVVGIVSIILAVATIAFSIIPMIITLIILGLLITGFVYTDAALLRKIWLIMAACMAFSVVVDIAFSKVLEDHQQKRIQVMLGIIDDPLGLGYNVDQSKTAIGSGGFLGKGYLQGTQTKGDFVPEQHTDFIFTSIGEEFGWLGCTILIALYVALFFRIIHIAERQRSKFSRVYAYCVLSILFFHFLINIAMTINLAPVIGIPLPFISYGGSSLISFTVMLFLLLRFDANRENELDSVNY
ncbi:MAG: rod shape-determining protein RodA [Flavobacteriales bacterium]|nr:rod shape-determining protein RodA [Flavobacteriales bacterium]